MGFADEHRLAILRVDHAVVAVAEGFGVEEVGCGALRGAVDGVGDVADEAGAIHLADDEVAGEIGGGERSCFRGRAGSGSGSFRNRPGGEEGWSGCACHRVSSGR